MARSKTSIRNEADALYWLQRELIIQATRVTLNSYVPHDKQVIFHTASEDIRLYIGGNRSGKTLGSVMEGIYWARGEHPFQRLPIVPGEPTRGRVCGVDFQSGVNKILLPQYAASIPKSLLINGSWEDSYNANEKVLSLRNSSFIEFMSYDQDLDKFAGTSRHWVHMDEEPPKPIYTENYARVVDTNGRMWISMTPVEGMTWVYDTLYEPGILGDNPNVKVIIVDMFDNPYTSMEAKNKFIAGLDSEDIEARIHGRFIQMGGLIYKSFDPEAGGMHIIKGGNINIPSNWIIILGLDHGLNNPTAVGWHAFSPEGDWITYDEHYKRGLTVEENAKIIKEKIYKQGRMPDQFIADPSIRQRDPITGTSIQQEYQKHGLFFGLGNNDVKAGIVRFSGYLKPRLTASGILLPKWHILEEACPMHIKEMKKYRWKTYETKKKQYENNPYDEPHKKDDHAMDELRYVAMSRPDIFSDIDQNKEDAYVRTGMLVPGTVGASATADDFFSSRNSMDMEYGDVRGQGVSEMEYDEHLGGVW